MRVDIQGAEEAARAINRLAQTFPDVTKQVSEDQIGIIVSRLESETVMRTPAGVGGAAGLRGSISSNTRQIFGGVVGTWGSPLKYGAAVEYGRKPGKMPPPRALELWVRRILGVSESEAPGVSFLVARKIGLRGTEGAHMFEEAWEASESWALGVIAGIPDKIMERVNA